jgi:hypothetical protein
MHAIHRSPPCVAPGQVSAHSELGDTRMQLYDLHSNEETQLVETAPVTSLALGRDGRSLLVNLQSQTIHLWDLSAPTPPLSQPQPPRSRGAPPPPTSSVRSPPKTHLCARPPSLIPQGEYYHVLGEDDQKQSALRSAPWHCT